MSSSTVTKRCSLPITSNLTLKTLVNNTDLLLSNWHRLSKAQIFQKYQPTIPIDLISIVSKYSKKVVQFDIYNKNHCNQTKYPTYDLFEHITDIPCHVELLCSDPINNNDGFKFKIDKMVYFTDYYSIKIGAAYKHNYPWDPNGYSDTINYFFYEAGCLLGNSRILYPSLKFEDDKFAVKKDDVIKIKVCNNTLCCWINDTELNSSQHNCNEICHELNKLHFRIRFTAIKNIKFRISDFDL